MRSNISKELIDKFIAGTCTPEEKQDVLDWYNSFDTEEDYLAVMPKREELQLRENIYERITDRMEVGEEEMPAGNRGRRWLISVVSGAAAMLLIAVGINYLKDPALTPVATDAVAGIEEVNNNTKYIIDRTLSDGSHVWLNPGSQVKFARNFKGNTRDVYMVGEAFFEVTKNTQKPFIVHSANLVTKVWGTSFRVRDSKSIAFADVSVVTGKVSVKLAGDLAKKSTAKEVMIHPDEYAVFHKQAETFKTDNTPDKQVLKMWKRQNLSFNDTPLPEVVEVLNRQFNSAIAIEDNSLTAYTINVDLTGLNLPEVLTIMCKTLNISYRVVGERILITQTN